MTEPAAGTDLQRIKAQARLEGDYWRINGAKTFITNGLHAGLVCVAVKTGAEGGAKGISLLMLETDASRGFPPWPAAGQDGPEDAGHHRVVLR